jgi:hypothetical protein
VALHIFIQGAGGGNVQPHARNTSRIQPGHPVGEFYGSVYDGVWKSQKEIDKVGTMPSAKPGDIRYKDTNGDGHYDTNDDVFLGDGNPEFSYGMTNNFSYKQLKLHIFLYGEYGNDVLNLPAERFIYSSSGTSVKRLQRWTPDNPDNPIPFEVGGKADRVSSALVENGSFLRIQNITLSYNIPVANWHLGALSSFKIGVAVDNLACITPYSGYDPEVNSYGNDNEVRGIDRYAYPASRSFRFILRLKF